MSVEYVEVAVADLLLDHQNARLGEDVSGQQEAALALAKLIGDGLLRMAADIIESGLDPTTTVAIVPTEDQRKRYLVLEGNRRVLTLKALDTPSLVASAFTAAQMRRLTDLAHRYASNPVRAVRCALFSSEDEARHWIELRHTGPNGGVGLVEWGANEKDRFAARKGRRSPAGQILDFVEKAGVAPDDGSTGARIITNIHRLISTPAVRERLGIEIVSGQVVTSYPKTEVAKGLSHVVDQLRKGELKVSQIYTADQRVEYATSLPAKVLPKKSSKQIVMASLADLISGAKPKPVATPVKRTRPRREAVRTALIPKSCQLNIPEPRINAIYTELLTLSAEQYPNAASVLVRVFLELSVDHYLMSHAAMSEPDRKKNPLSKRMKVAADHLQKAGKMDSQLRVAVDRMADGQFLVGASTITFNQYVHNKWVYPKASELRSGWDELQPFMERLWA